MASDAEVAIPSFQMPIRNLSGGNQQRLVARREMRIAETLLVAAYPSRGLDVGAIETLLTYLVELRNKGVAVDEGKPKLELDKFNDAYKERMTNYGSVDI